MKELGGTIYNRTVFVQHLIRTEELTGNSFTDHVTNTCSDDSRSRGFIVV